MGDYWDYGECIDSLIKLAETIHTGSAKGIAWTADRAVSSNEPEETGRGFLETAVECALDLGEYEKACDLARALGYLERTKEEERNLNA